MPRDEDSVDADRLDYQAAGVDSAGAETALGRLAKKVRQTFALAGAPGEPGAVHLDLGYFANVIEIGQGLGIAVSTDGVGTKLLVAQMLDKYDTIGIDCVAMNVNDVLSVGARPLTLVDYIAVEQTDPAVLASIAEGLYRGAQAARISIAGGELAQLAEVIRGARPGTGFDLVGTAIGLVPLDRLIVGEGLRDGDAVIGLTSSGIHSNGLTLARKALLNVAGFQLDQHVAELGRTLGEELLQPTRIYVQPILALLDAVDEVKALQHITGDGFLNLLRIKSRSSFEITALPEPPPIFQLIQDAAGVDDAEMFRVFNMGLGFCAVVGQAAAQRAVDVLRDSGAEDARVIGRVRTESADEVLIPAHGLRGTREGGFRKV